VQDKTKTLVRKKTIQEAKKKKTKKKQSMHTDYCTYHESVYFHPRRPVRFRTALSHRFETGAQTSKIIKSCDCGRGGKVKPQGRVQPFAKRAKR
jgi:hypothetical protein